MLGALLRIPFQAIVARIDRDLAAAGFDDLRPAHFAVFQVIEPGGSRLTTLAAQAQMTKQSMGYLVDHLEAHGYVERVADPADGRAKIVRLTGRGWEVDRTARAIVARIEQEWAALLGDDRLADLRRTLRDLAAMLEE
jgi:DNA-binding MarR family transcriptional regulator